MSTKVAQWNWGQAETTTNLCDITTISPLIQLLKQIAKHQYELKAPPNNQIKSSSRKKEQNSTPADQKKKLQDSAKEHALLNQPRGN
jgi:hypothetical protein